MQDTYCLSLNPNLSFGATAGKERGLQRVTSLSAEMKSAEEGKNYFLSSMMQRFNQSFKMHILASCWTDRCCIVKVLESLLIPNSTIM